MSDVEILGKPLYRSRKLQDEEQNLSNQQESKKRPTDPDLQYERDEKDWWWCEDLWLRDYRWYISKSMAIEKFWVRLTYEENSFNIFIFVN